MIFLYISSALDISSSIVIVNCICIVFLLNHEDKRNEKTNHQALHIYTMIYIIAYYFSLRLKTCSLSITYVHIYRKYIYTHGHTKIIVSVSVTEENVVHLPIRINGVVLLLDVVFIYIIIHRISPLWCNIYFLNSWTFVEFHCLFILKELIWNVAAAWRWRPNLRSTDTLCQRVYIFILFVYIMRESIKSNGPFSVIAWWSLTPTARYRLAWPMIFTLTPLIHPLSHRLAPVNDAFEELHACGLAQYNVFHIPFRLGCFMHKFIQSFCFDSNDYAMARDAAMATIFTRNEHQLC